jgi:hypothetical protein
VFFFDRERVSCSSSSVLESGRRRRDGANWNLAPEPNSKTFPVIPHSDLGVSCIGTLVCEPRGFYDCLICDKCGEVLGAANAGVLAAVAVRLRGDRAGEG